MTEQTGETQAPQASEAAPSRPDGLADAFWDSGANSVRMDDLIASHADLSQQAQVSADLMAAIPEEASGYEVALPDGFEVPEGFEFSLDGDERVSQLQEWAHENKVQPDALKKLMGIYAQDRLEHFNTMAAQMAELGVNASGRISDVKISVRSRVGDADAEALFNDIGTAAAVRAVEKLVAGSGSASPAPRHETSGQDDLMNIENPYERAMAISARASEAK